MINAPSTLFNTTNTLEVTELIGVIAKAFYHVALWLCDL